MLATHFSQAPLFLEVFCVHICITLYGHSGHSCVGGVMFHQDCSITVNNSAFSGNTAIQGGVMNHEKSNVSIDNCVFTNNTAITFGGVMSELTSNVTVHNSNFTNNAALQGGVMGSRNSSVIINNCTFSNNAASELGGVMFHEVTSATVYNCTFNGNSASEGGVMNHKKSNVNIVDCIFTNNTAITFGGVMSELTSNVTVHNSNFTNNAALHGGVMDSRNSSAIINNCTFSNNAASELGGVMFHEITSATVYNCTFNGNSASQGGVMNHKKSNVSIVDCIFTNHTANKFGGVMANQDSNVTVHNSTFNNNTAIQGGVMDQEGNNVTIISCIFTNNSANKLGGVMLHEITSATVYNCTFNGNSASQGGVMNHKKSNVSIVDCVFTNNTAIKFGGVMSELTSNVTVHNSNFTNNAALQGGVMGSRNSSAIINNCIFTYNTASELGGVVVHAISSVAVCNCSFCGNSASEGGVMNHEKSNVSINNCVFTNNTANRLGGAISQLTSNITIHNSYFSNNAALQGGVMDSRNSSTIIITINNCVFTNNTAIVYGGVMSVHDHLGSNALVQSNSAIIQGGVMNSNVSIKKCVFTNNTATKLGGVMYNVYSDVIIHDSIFTKNIAGDDGGVMVHIVGNVTMNNSCFTNNFAKKQGAIFSFITTSIKSYGDLVIEKNNAKSSNLLFVTDSKLSLAGIVNISNNRGRIYISTSNITFTGQIIIANNLQTHEDGGSLSTFQSEVVFSGTVTIHNNKASNASGGAIALVESKLYTYGLTTISNNTARNGGGISAYQSELNFEGRNVIRYNTAEKRGGGIYSASSTVNFLPGNHQLSENNANKGGGMCLELNAKIYALVKFTKPFFDRKSNQFYASANKQNTSLEFKNNFATYGGAIFVSDDTNSGVCVPNEYLRVNECFLQVLDLASYKINLTQKESINYFHFNNNTATIRGDTLYGGLLDRCTLNPYSEIFNMFQNYSVSSSMLYLKMPVTNIEEWDIKSVISSDPVRVCFCQFNQPDCSYYPPTFHVWKGERLKVSLVAVDQVNNTISNTPIHSSTSPQAGLGEGQSIQTTGNGCTELTYTVTSPHNSETITVFAEGPCKDSGISASRFQIAFKPCPIGFIDTKSKCDCDPKLFGYITNCSIDTRSVLRENASWISYINTSKTQDYLTYPYCPFDYCHPSSKTIWINLNIPNGADEQCAFNRSGKLCGSCEDRLSFTFGSSRCKPCSNNWLSLLIVFAIAGVALVAFIHVLNMTVVVGTINALIFFANVVSSNHTIFMPFRKPNPWTVFIAWINLDLGFETCFYDGMDGYAKTWLQLAFPSYILLLVVVVIIASEYSNKITRIVYLSRQRNPISTLATLVLLSYTKILRTIIAALSFARLEYPDGYSETVWLVDANVRYFEWKHIILLTTAIVILLVGLVLTFLILFWQWFQKYSNKLPFPRRFFTYDRLESFMIVYLAPYNKNHRYYMGVLLLARAILYLISALTSHLDPSYTLLATILISTCLLMIECGTKMFKQWPNKVLETLFLLNLIVFAACTYHVRNAGGNQTILAKLSISIAIIAFLVVLMYHTYALLLHKVILKFKHLFQHRRDTETRLHSASPYHDVSTCTAPTHSEIDACPPIEDTNTDATTNSEDSRTSGNTTQCQTEETYCTSPHTPPAEDTPSLARDTNTNQSVVGVIDDKRQDEMSIELQSFVGQDDITQGRGEMMRLEESEEYDDETTPLLMIQL